MYLCTLRKVVFTDFSVNGAGKSTTMKMLLGLTAPTDGEFQIDNLTFPNDRVQILKKSVLLLTPVILSKLNR